MANNESWGSRIGLILAMAGNAVGLGNFLRFPVQAVQNGGGAFIIPYLVCFLLMGIPLLYVEWAMGRFGGKQGRHSTPFILDTFSKQAMWKYVGVFGIFTNIAVAAYYCYLESWTLSYMFHSVTGTFSGKTQTEVAGFFSDYISLHTAEPVIFWLICLVLNIWILSKGLSGGVEKTAKIGMPLLIVFGIFLAVKGVTLKAGEHGAINNGTVGLNYLWTPDFSSIWSMKVWLAAAGQIFFTLSVGMGSIHCYASYVKQKDDIALNSQSAGWMNEFVEVVLGSSILIPIAIGYLGIDKVVEMTRTGGLGLGFQTFPYLFQQWGSIIAIFAGVFWFGLLFFAGITSSLAMGTPCMAFLEDEFGWKRENAALAFGIVILILGLPTVLFFNEGVFDEYDYWAGTVSLVIFALFEIILFSWIFGLKRGWKEITDGADIKVPVFFKYIIKWVTPFILIIIFFFSLPDIWNTINHTSTKKNITYATQPQQLLKENLDMQQAYLKDIPDSIVYQSDGIMNNERFTSAQKNAILNCRSNIELFKKFSHPTFNADEYRQAQEKVMLYKNISRPFLLFIFVLTMLLVRMAYKRRLKNNLQTR